MGSDLFIDQYTGWPKLMEPKERVMKTTKEAK